MICREDSYGTVWSCQSNVDTSACLARRRYVPSDVSEKDLQESEAWLCDSRSAASACLLLLCAIRESLKQGSEALHLTRALTDVCSALGHWGSGHDSMVWGCDLDPGTWATQKPLQPGLAFPA
jgi:hypothetical protein